MVEAERIVKVSITDWSGYDPDRCNNGGGYSYTTTYYRKDDDKWDVIYSTSAEFEYCPYCGMFGSGCRCTHPQQATTDVVMERITALKDDRDYTVVLTLQDGTKRTL